MKKIDMLYLKIMWQYDVVTVFHKKKKNVNKEQQLKMYNVLFIP